MKCEKIIKKHKSLIDKAIEYMNKVQDKEHNYEHVKDVIYFSLTLLEKLKDKFDINIDAVIIACFWHDVGRIKCDIGHENLSSIMLKKEMVKENYDAIFIDNCIEAIRYHKWNMNPKTIEGKIIKDADKLAWLGVNRWKECIKYDQNLDSIVDLLPKLRNEILYFDESKKIYDEEIVKLVKLLYSLKFDYVNKS